MVLNAWYGKLLYIVIDSSYHRDLLCLCYHARFGRKILCRAFLARSIERKLLLSKLLRVSCSKTDSADAIRSDSRGRVAIPCFNPNWRAEYCSLVSSIPVKLMMSLLGFGCIPFFLCFSASRFWNLFSRRARSFVPWRHKISWVRALIDRIHWICTPNKIKTELKLIRKFLWRGMVFLNVLPTY